MRKLRCCPTCKRPFPPEIVVRGERRQALLNFLLNHPDGVRRDEIIDYVYADDSDGGPTNLSIVSVMVSNLNDILKRNNEDFRIRGTGGPGSQYTIVSIAEYESKRRKKGK
jgi:DNA-binding winged helix-turn-helix (wHTH) protein